MKKQKINTIMVLHKRCGHAPRIIDVPDTLESLQNLVGGCIEVVPLTAHVVLVCNETGKLDGLDPNPFMGMPDLVGDWFICGVSGEDFCSLSKDVAAYLYFTYPAMDGWKFDARGAMRDD